MSAANFHELAIFPLSIAIGSVGGPEFSTSIVMTGTRREHRNQNWEQPIDRWNAATGVKTNADMQTLLGFFYARRGRMFGFRFEDPDDHEAVGETIGTADGVTDTFQLVKSSGGISAYEFDRKIVKPYGVVTVYLDGVPIAATTDTSTGIVTITGGPPSSGVVTADFSFHLPMRFDTDRPLRQLSSYLGRDVVMPMVSDPNEW